MYPYAFFDVDSLELSPNGRTYVCHPNVSSISDQLFETYTVIASIAAPLIFSVDVDSNAPNNNNNKRRDFLPIPVNNSDREWQASVGDRLKIYIERIAQEDKAKNALFNNNQNALDCIKLIKTKEWIVFGNGLKNQVDHVMSTLLGLVNRIKYVPELIVPGKNETNDQLIGCFQKWEEKGAIPFTYDEIIELIRDRKPKLRT